MSDLDIITVGFCPQYRASFRVPGSRGDSWEVFFDSHSCQPQCSCPAWTFSARDVFDRRCKHIDLVWAHGCLFNPQGGDPGPNDYAAHGISMRAGSPETIDEACPGCGHLMIPVRVGV